MELSTAGILKKRKASTPALYSCLWEMWIFRNWVAWHWNPLHILCMKVVVTKIRNCSLIMNNFFSFCSFTTNIFPDLYSCPMAWVESLSANQNRHIPTASSSITPFSTHVRDSSDSDPARLCPAYPLWQARGYLHPVATRRAPAGRCRWQAWDA